MAKTTQHETDNGDGRDGDYARLAARIDALERENAELRAARQGGSALETIVDRIEQTSPALALKKMNERFAALADQKARELMDCWRRLLDGERPFLFAIVARSKFGNDVVPRPNLVGHTGLLVFASDELTAQQKYFEFQGINTKNPPPSIGTFHDGTTCECFPIDDAAAMQLRAQCLAIVDKGGDDVPIKRLMHKACEKAAVEFLERAQEAFLLS